MPVQVAQIPNFQSQAINAPAMSGRDPGAQALGSLAQSIAGVSEAFAGQAQRIQKVENARIISENRNRLSEEYANFQIENQKETDPEKRMAATMTFLKKQQQTLDQPGYSPYVRDALTGHFDNFANSARIRSVEDAANLTVKRAGLSLSNEIEEAKRTGDRSLFEAAKATGREAGILLPEQEQALDMDFDRNIQFQSARMQAEDSPLDAIEALESESFLTTNPGLYPEDQDKLIRYAKQQIEVKRGDEIDLLENALAEGKLGFPDIKAAEFLSPKDRRAIASSLKKTEQDTPISQQEYLNAWKVADTLRAARNDPKVSDDSYRLIHNEARTDILNRVPPSLQGDLKKELGYLSPAGRDTSQPVKASDRTELESIARAQISRAHDAGMYGDVSKESPFETREKAARKAEDLRLHVKRFIESRNPPPDPAEIRSYVDTLNGTAIDGDTPLIPAIPAPFSIGSEIDSLLAPLPGLPPGAGAATDLILPPK